MTDAQTAAPGILRAHAETAYADELRALAAADDRPRPPSWRLSPWAVATYILGGTLPDGTQVSPKYLGSARLVEIAVASLATDRGLLLLGVPGTAKTWLGEHLAAAISGTSTLVVQGTAGTPEEALRYGWNYARLLADGPSRAALVARPGNARHGVRQPGPGGGAHPDPLGRAGFTHHHHERKNAAHPRTQHRSAGRQGVQRHCHRKQPRQGRQRPVIGAAPPVQHRGAAPPRQPRPGSGDRHAPACGALAQHSSFRPTLPRSPRSAGWSR